MPGRRQPLARAIRELAQIGLEAGDDSPVTFEEALARVTTKAEPGYISRRDLLKIGGAFGAAWALEACTSGGPKTPARSSAPLRTSTPTAHDARVVVVGAGLAGVTAAYRLAQAGVGVQLFESRDRVGGRCWSARGFADGQTAEHGSEFIDTRHVHTIGLAKELGLDLEDLWKGWVNGSMWPNWVGGKVLDHKQIQDLIHPVAAKVTEEAKRIGVIPAGGGKPTDAAYSFGTATPAAVELDQMTMSEWLHANAPGVTASPFGTYLNEIMAGWYGLDMAQLSAVTWMDYFVIPVTGADERWHVKGGNDQIPNLAARKLPSGTLHLETPLTALRARSDGSYELRFDGMPSPVVADFVILALPFTTLRQVDLTDAGFSGQRQYAIDNQGMGNRRETAAPVRPTSVRVHRHGAEVERRDGALRSELRDVGELHRPARRIRAHHRVRGRCHGFELDGRGRPRPGAGHVRIRVRRPYRRRRAGNRRTLQRHGVARPVDA